jgi:hypothetical protein
LKLLLALLTASLLSITSLNGAVIYSSFGPGDTFHLSAFGFGPILYIGNTFASAETCTLDTIDLALSTQTWFDTYGARIALTDITSDGKPGAILEIFDTGPLPPFEAPSIVTVTSSLHPTLQQGARYFLILGGGLGGGWFYTADDFRAVPSVAGVSMEKLFLTDASGLAFRVEGTLVEAAIPEPGTFWLAGLAVLGLLAGRLREV